MSETISIIFIQKVKQISTALEVLSPYDDPKFRLSNNI